MCLKQRITRSAFERSSARRQKETRSILMRSAEFWLVQYCFVAKGMSCLISSMSVGYVNTRDDHNSKRQHVYEAKAICWSKLLELKMCYLYFFCLHCLINIHIFDYPDSQLSGLFTLVPLSPDNRGLTVLTRRICFKIRHSWDGDHLCYSCDLNEWFSSITARRN